MKTKILTLALLSTIFISCSNDDSPVSEEPTPTPVNMCDCLITRYRVHTTYEGTPYDTTWVSSGYRLNSDGSTYKEECGTNRWQVDYATMIDNNPFYYETENYKAQ
ncbi:hypothetical protein [Flavobacterium sp.]|uniref:hypothetical protein n=1 Tax=Flavobacterium sp. TaxID=239 RepID=UPI002FDEF970